MAGSPVLSRFAHQQSTELACFFARVQSSFAERSISCENQVLFSLGLHSTFFPSPLFFPCGDAIAIERNSEWILKNFKRWRGETELQTLLPHSKFHVILGEMREVKVSQMDGVTTLFLVDSKMGGQTCDAHTLLHFVDLFEEVDTIHTLVIPRDGLLHALKLMNTKKLSNLEKKRYAVWRSLLQDHNRHRSLTINKLADHLSTMQTTKKIPRLQVADEFFVWNQDFLVITKTLAPPTSDDPALDEEVKIMPSVLQNSDTRFVLHGTSPTSDDILLMRAVNQNLKWEDQEEQQEQVQQRKKRKL